MRLHGRRLKACRAFADSVDGSADRVNEQGRIASRSHDEMPAPQVILRRREVDGRLRRLLERPVSAAPHDADDLQTRAL